MKSYQATALIEAPPEKIWSILTDGASYTAWDSGVLRLEGTIAPGERLKVTSAANPKRAFSVRVTDFTPGSKMVWAGGMPLGLFKGVRTFRLRPEGDGKTRFDVREVYSGPMLGMIWKSMPDLGPSFEQFAGGLKARAESS